MNSTLQQSPVGVGRIRRVTAIVAIGALPLLAAACAQPADPTNVGAGAGAPSISVSNTPAGGTTGSTGGSSSSAASSTPSSGPEETSSAPNSEEPTVGSDVPDSLRGSAFTSTSITGRQAVKDAPLTISFDAAGERSGLGAGCNSMGGGPVFEGTTLAYPQIVSTMMACVGGGGAIMKQESWYSKWLKDGVDYSLKGTTLTLEGAGVTVVFERSGDADAPSGTSVSSTPSADPSAPDQPTSDGGMTTQAEPAPVESGRTPIPGATVAPGTQGSAIPIPPTTN